MRQNLLQSVTAIKMCDKRLLRSVTDITKCDNYYKVRHNSALKQVLQVGNRVSFQALSERFWQL